ncbi:Aldo/keto reductase [Irpex rosettiformis]|uniref:Aldo/keto reductase n=1 Tax=Irpex rosettiformis TaxID=378272 RepID=A0ACB8UJ21_9APHY|nr:Aldo/keto reductase [Irpex rosettiformis]
MRPSATIARRHVCSILPRPVLHLPIRTLFSAPTIKTPPRPLPRSVSLPLSFTSTYSTTTTTTMSSPVITLKRTGAKMPAIGFGTWKVPNEQAADTVYNAIKAGYRLFDGAADYGNEKECGDGIRRAIQDGIVTREEIWVTTKIWNSFHKREHLLEVAKHQSSLWGLDYIDLLLVHFPCTLEHIPIATRFPPGWHGLDGQCHPVRNIPYQETWGAMEELVDSGLAKNIGISNVSGSLLNDILSYAKYDPQVNQVEIHPYLTQEGLIELCKYHGIAITAYCSFGPASWAELNMHGHVESLFEHQSIKSVAQEVGKTEAQVLLRWALQQGLAVIPKSNNPIRLAQNFQVSQFELTEAQMKAISALNRNYRMNDPQSIHISLGIFS